MIGVCRVLDEEKFKAWLKSSGIGKYDVTTKVAVSDTVMCNSSFDDNEVSIPLKEGEMGAKFYSTGHDDSDFWTGDDYDYYNWEPTTEQELILSFIDGKNDEIGIDCGTTSSGAGRNG